MNRQPMFVRTSKGYLNLGLVRLIDDKSDPEVFKFIFDDQRGQFITLSKKEGWRVISTMTSELMICME
jgi:hypothetical protein